MSPIMTIYLIIFAVFFIVIGYFVYGFYKDHRDEIQHIRSCRKHARRKDALAIDYWRMDPVFGLDDHRQWMDDTMRWVPKGKNFDEPYEDLYREGYMSAQKWMTQLRYFGVPVFVRLHNFKTIDPRTMDENITGYPTNELTSSIMYNVYSAKTVKRFIDNLSKISWAEMDIKGLGLIIPIIIGVGVGCVWLLLGGF